MDWLANPKITVQLKGESAGTQVKSKYSRAHLPHAGGVTDNCLISNLESYSDLDVATMAHF